MDQKDNSKLISKIEKSGLEEIQVRLVEWKDQTYCDVRVWYRKDDGTVLPSTKGLRFNVELLDELRSALDAAAKEAEGGVEIKPDDASAEKGEAKGEEVPF